MSEPIRYLIGSKVYLRPLEMEDIDFMYQSGNNDVEMRRLTGTQTSFTRAQIEQYIERQWQDDSRVSFGVLRSTDDQLIGEVVLNEINRNCRSANFRIAISDVFHRASMCLCESRPIPLLDVLHIVHQLRTELS